ncbi:MAG: hypothetical protein NT062_12345 [Proteobacteria bacterium]|nr:hypothetical protein [Pseudomonadota bacterium]
MGALSKILASTTLTAALMLGAGCGATDTPPGPLGRHFDDMYIAQIPLAQKQAVVDSQQAWSIAKMENAKAEADVNDSTTQLTVSQNGLRTLHIGVETAITQKQSAQKSADTNKINTATKDLNVAENLEKAGRAHVQYLQAYRDYLRVYWRFTQENMYWQEARFEVAKSSLAQRSNIAPQNIKYEWFPGQEQERGKRTASAKTRADASRANVSKSRDNWLAMQKAADTANGHPSNLADPMAPPVAPTPPVGTPTPAAPAAPAPAQ